MPNDATSPLATLVRLFGTMAVPQARALFAEILGGAPLVVPSSNRDLQSEELRPLIDRFYRGSTGDAHDRAHLRPAPVGHWRRSARATTRRWDD